jgi:hypothetical protein
MDKGKPVTVAGAACLGVADAGGVAGEQREAEAMRLETYLNAMTVGIGDMYQWKALSQTTKYNHRKRQVLAFRARILRMFEEKDAEILRLKQGVFDIVTEKRDD